MISTSSISGDSSARGDPPAEVGSVGFGDPATTSAALLAGRKPAHELGVGLLRAGVLREFGPRLRDRAVPTAGETVLTRRVARVGLDVGRLRPRRPFLEAGVEQLLDVVLARLLAGRLGAGLDEDSAAVGPVLEQLLENGAGLLRQLGEGGLELAEEGVRQTLRRLESLFFGVLLAEL